MEKRRQETGVSPGVGNSSHGPGICPTSAWLYDLETIHSTSLSLNFPIYRMDNIIHPQVLWVTGRITVVIHMTHNLSVNVYSSCIIIIGYTV